MEKFSEKFGKIPRIVKMAGGLAALAAVAKINYELNPKPEVTVLNLHGTIVASRAGLNGQPPINMENLRKKIDFAFKPKRLQYVLLNINSPGGSPVQCDLISSYIKKKSEETEIALKETGVEKEAADKFMKIKDAYEKITDLDGKRARRQARCRSSALRSRFLARSSAIFSSTTDGRPSFAEPCICFLNRALLALATSSLQPHRPAWLPSAAPLTTAPWAHRRHGR